MRHLHPGRNEKTGIIDDEAQGALPLGSGPADKPVPVLALPSRCPKDQTGQEATLAVPHDVLQVLADRSAKTQIMKLTQRRFYPGTLGGLGTHLTNGQHS